MSPPRPVSQEAALDTLRRLARAGTRTLLFAGPDGVGRRAAARWFAALLNCRAAGDEPCGSCAECGAWRQADGSLRWVRDYREVSAATTTKEGRAARRPTITIDQLVPRAGGDHDPLGPWLASAPSARVRVAVIDGADELGEGAANAFLKTLEEPPSHARIVLVAPGPDTLLPTVASRCTVVRFKPVPADAETVRRFHPHPALRLGRPASLLEASDEARSAVSAFEASLHGSLAETFEGLKALIEVWQSGEVPGMLRERARARGAATYLACDAALEEAEAASSAYAHRALVFKRLALALRSAWRHGPGELPS